MSILESYSVQQKTNYIFNSSKFPTSLELKPQISICILLRHTKSDTKIFNLYFFTRFPFYGCSAGILLTAFIVLFLDIEITPVRTETPWRKELSWWVITIFLPSLCLLKKIVRKFRQISSTALVLDNFYIKYCSVLAQ